MAKKPIKFALKGEGVVTVSSEGEKEYLAALKAEEDIINVCVKAKGFNSFPIMRNQVQLNDPAFMISGGFDVKRVGKSKKYKVCIDGVVSTDSLTKKDLEAIAEGSATCTLEGIGARGNWRLSDEDSRDQIGISVAL